MIAMPRAHKHLFQTSSEAQELSSTGRVIAAAIVFAMTASLMNICVVSATSIGDFLDTQQMHHIEPKLWEEERDSSEVSFTRALSDSIDADRRKALRSEHRRWPNAVVPFVISSSVDQVSSSARQIIQDAMGHWESETCIRFVPANILKDKDYIVFEQDDWCRSLAGRRGGKQSISVAAGCLKVGSIVHELGHAIGWVHEHARPDRDKYLEILWKNVRRNVEAQFNKNDDSHINTFGLPYDYGSIMHYNGSSSGTVRALDQQKQKLMGQRVRLSFYDAKLANLMYKCAEKNKCDINAMKCIGEGYVGPKCTCICPDYNTKCAGESAPGMQ